MPVSIHLPTTRFIVKDRARRGLDRAAVVDREFLGIDTILGEVRPDLRVWMDRIAVETQGTMLGLCPDGVDPEHRRALRDAGMPFAAQGALRWGEDIRVGSRLTIDDAGFLEVPDASILARLNGIELRPLRRFVAARCGCRLQTGPRVAFYLWPRQALLVSLQAVPVGGFLHGPGPGQRHCLSLEPGQGQLLAW